VNDFSQNILLGQATSYVSEYDPALLCPFPRQLKRDEIGIGEALPFTGCDIWNAYEVSWLSRRGVPQVALARFFFDCSSPFLIESKSLKLYLNSFNQTRLQSADALRQCLIADLSAAGGAPVDVEILSLDEGPARLDCLPGVCIDSLDIEIDSYQLNARLLQVDESCRVSESLHSHLLKSNCLVTSQPDWGSVLIDYTGPQLQHESLLRYLVSFREHNEFHEQCVERIFVDLLRCCQMEQLSVQAWYTRRGGLDINPFRTNCEQSPRLLRLPRQ
jgi:7-cyano-7-deazaguanine reductase